MWMPTTMPVMEASPSVWQLHTLCPPAWAHHPPHAAKHVSTASVLVAYISISNISTRSLRTICIQLRQTGSPDICCLFLLFFVVFFSPEYHDQGPFSCVKHIHNCNLCCVKTSPSREHSECLVVVLQSDSLATFTMRNLDETQSTFSWNENALKISRCGSPLKSLGYSNITAWSEWMQGEGGLVAVIAILLPPGVTLGTLH